MLLLILVSALLAGSLANNPKDDVGFINLKQKSVKGGEPICNYRGEDDINRFFNHTRRGYVAASQTNHEVGVCYLEVPTSTLARDPKHVPAGNGTRPGYSRIRSCCHGYTRNIHNYLICDPVCSIDCINALCTATEVCTCFRDHIKNLAGFCMPTCPIGCQNGHCNGAMCLCKEGFKLDVSGRFCVPHCRDNCGGTGNCTAPNECERPGSHPRPYPGSVQVGSYQPGVNPVPGSNQNAASPAPGSTCGTCRDGYCWGTECRCRPGYLLYRGDCKPLCNPNCAYGKDCIAPNVCAPNTIGVNATNQANGGYPNQPQNSYQNPSQYPNSQYPQNQNQYPQNPNQQYPNSHPGQQQPTNPIYAPYPGQQNQYPGQQNNDPRKNPSHPNGANTGYPNQGQYPQQQHLYPKLPTYPDGPQTHGNSVNTSPRPGDGQVYYQNRPYNPLDNVTYNLHQGGSDQISGEVHKISQGQHYGGGQYPQGQFSIGQTKPGQFINMQTSQGQFSNGQTKQGQFINMQTSPGQFSNGQTKPGQFINMQTSQGQFSNGQTKQGQFINMQTSQGQFSIGQTSQGQLIYGQTSQGQHGRGDIDQSQYYQNIQGQYGQGQYSQGQYGQGQNSQGQFSQGQYGHGQYNQGQYGQGQYGQGQYHQGQYPYVQSTENPHGKISSSGLICEQPCFNGNCDGFNKCECLPGYNKDPTDSTGTRCNPYCPGGCANGFCGSPNNCVCAEGFHKEFSEKGRQACVRRFRRAAQETPVKVSDLLVFEIPEFE